MTKNVTVTDESGKIIGTTYPKRARGLIKNGRALYVDDCTIRLSAGAGPSDYKSEVKHMHNIFFNPREWNCGDAAKQNIFSEAKSPTERTFINGFDGELVEVLMFGDWNKNAGPATGILSRIYSLTPNDEYRFVFWLNGGENDTNNEVCQLRIYFPGHGDDWNTYRLNRNFIKPLLHWQGWELYSIAFRTPEALLGMDTVPVVNTQFCFVSKAAPMAVMPAKEPEFYKDWQDSPDEFAQFRPQRHNIVFKDGWPARNEYGGDKYSTEAIRERLQAQGKAADRAASDRSASGSPTGAKWGRFGEAWIYFQELTDRYRMLKEQMSALEAAAEGYRRASREDDEAGWELADDLEEKLAELDSALAECEDLLENVIPADVLNCFGNAEDSLDEAEELRDEIRSRLDRSKT